MASVVSRNPFDLLGDSEDTETVVSKEKEQPSKEPVVVQKKIDRSRASPKEARIRHEYPQRGGHKSSTSNRSNEDTRSAPRDRNVGPRLSGRREEGGGGGGGGGGDYQSTRSVRGARPNERGRGGRGGRRGGRDYDRHSATGRYDSEKKENQGWGNPTESSYEAAATTTTTTTVDSSWNTEANDVKSNWNDNANDTSGSWGNTTEEKSATTDAWATTTTTTTEEKSGDNNDAWNTNDTTTAESWVQQPESEIKVEDNNNTTGDSAPPPEIEETTKTLDEYLAEKSQKSLDLSLPEARKPNEGADDSQWKEAVLLEKEEDEDALFTGKEQSYRLKNKNKKSKNFVDITQTFDGNRGGPSRGRGRGRGGRGGGRGREDRDRDRDGRDDNNSNRRHRGGGGGGGGRSGLVNLDDQRAFPSLGAS